MAPGWEMGMGMEFGMGMGMGMGASVSPSIAASGAPTYNNTTTTTSPAYLYGLPSADTLRIDDLLDFSNHDLFPSSSSAAATDAHLLPLPETTSAAGEAGSSSDHHPHLTSFPDDLYIPSEEAAELEWLSNFVEDSFSDIPYPYSTTNLCSANAQIRVDPISSVPGRGARSKRSRGSAANTADAATAAPTWSSLTSPLQSSSSSSTSSSSSSDFPTHTNNRKKGGVGEVVNRIGMEGGVRRCTHCASEKTPQWRTGPLGPKTLCNACGVRYKSGRLVPEYRPAASPTFVLTQHSNSHRKVMELRRQKEQLHHLRHDNPSSSARPGLIYHDYEVC